MENQFLAEEISKREYQITNRDKMIAYLQNAHKERGEEIRKLREEMRLLKLQLI